METRAKKRVRVEGEYTDQLENKVRVLERKVEATFMLHDLERTFATIIIQEADTEIKKLNTEVKELKENLSKTILSTSTKKLELEKKDEEFTKIGKEIDEKCFWCGVKYLMEMKERDGREYISITEKTEMYHWYDHWRSCRIYQPIETKTDAIKGGHNPDYYQESKNSTENTN